MSKTIYTWTVNNVGYTWTREVQGEVDEWFTLEVGYTKDAVLPNASGIGRVILDAGAFQYPPLELRAEFATKADKLLVKGLVWQTGELTNTSDRTADVMLVRAREPLNPRGRYLLDLTFEKYD